MPRLPDNVRDCRRHSLPLLWSELRQLTMQRLAFVFAALVLASCACGQAMAWDIPLRGAHVYSRTTKRFEVTAPPSKLSSSVAIEDGASPTPHTWKYFATEPAKVPANFEQPGFSDAGWATGQPGFGPDPANNQRHRSPWTSNVICARTSCDLGPKKPKALWFQVDHDDGVRIWLNGELVVANDGYGQGPRQMATR